MNIEILILRNLLREDEYTRKVLPYLKSEYFESPHYKVLFDIFSKIYTEYNNLPSKESLLVEIGESDLIDDEELYDKTVELTEKVFELKGVDLEWLFDKTEKFCQDRSIHLAVFKSIDILDGTEKKLTKGDIPELLTDALAISFDSDLGHDYFEDVDKRIEFYQRTEERIPFDIDMLNKITRGGLPKKSLNVILMGCVHPDTKIKIRYKKGDENCIEVEICISDIENLLDGDYEVEVESPDGFIPVDQYVDKGMWDEYVLVSDDGESVRCNENHLFETNTGWMTAEEISKRDNILVLTKRGYVPSKVIQTGEKIPIVDITVNHPNHRYYTNGVSSHNTGVGKTAMMCHMAAMNVMAGYNPLYITLEMAEERIGERIDANLLNIDLNMVEETPEALFRQKFDKLAAREHGRFLIKEYPTTSAGVGHFRHQLRELKIKKNYVPDIIYIDYINICASTRYKFGSNVNSYTMVKGIAEELRGFSMEKGVNLPIVTGTQSNRGGQSSTDLDLDDTAESFGLPQTADFMLAAMRPDELRERNQIMFKQLKNRYRDVDTDKKFVLGIDTSKMRLFDTDDQIARGEEGEDVPVDMTLTKSDKFKKFRV